MVIGVTAAGLVLALAGMKLVPQQFFPYSDRPELVIDLHLKEGASFEATTTQVKRMEAALAKETRCWSIRPISVPVPPASTWP